MKRAATFAAIVASLLAASASAAPILLAKGTLNGSAAGANADLSGLTAPLENGQPGNLLGGLGSGIAYAGGNSFIALPDRGPNAVAYNANVDNTTSYISRFQSVSMVLTPNAPGSALPYTLTPDLTGTTLLYSSTALNYGTGVGLNNDNGTALGSGVPGLNTASSYYFTGRSDNFGAGNSGNAANARFDPEGVRVSNDGKSVFISDEYGPYIRQFDRATGQLIKTFTLPANLDITNQSASGNAEISGNTIGRVANKGMEGLAITPDGKTLVGIMQAALEQDKKGYLRIVTVDIATGTTHEYGYRLSTGSGVSEIVAVNDHQFLVDERDGEGQGGDPAVTVSKKIYLIDIAGATDITASSNTFATVTKSATAFLDITSALVASGVPLSQVPSKIEGLAFGQDVTYNGSLLHTLYVSTDNDFLASSGPNQFFVFGVSDADLGNYVPQAIAAVPEPQTWATLVLGFAATGAALRRKRMARRITA